MTSETETLQMIHLAVIDLAELQSYQLGALLAVGVLLCWVCTWPLRGKI